MNDIIQCVKYDLNLKSHRMPMNTKNQRNSLSRVPSLCCMYSPARHLLQLHHVHGRLQRGHHHHDTQLPPSPSRYPRDAKLGERLLLTMVFLQIVFVWWFRSLDISHNIHIKPTHYFASGFQSYIIISLISYGATTSSNHHKLHQNHYRHNLDSVIICRCVLFFSSGFLGSFAWAGLARKSPEKLSWCRFRPTWWFSSWRWSWLWWLQCF